MSKEHKCKGKGKCKKAFDDKSEKKCCPKPDSSKPANDTGSCKPKDKHHGHGGGGCCG